MNLDYRSWRSWWLKSNSINVSFTFNRMNSWQVSFWIKGTNLLRSFYRWEDNG